MDTKVTEATLEHYLSGTSLSEDTKARLRADFKKTGGDRKVLDEAVRLSGRKSMSKVSTPQTK